MAFFRKKEMIIILAVLAVCIAGLLIYRHTSADAGAKAEIYYYSTLVMTVNLDGHIDKTFSIPQNEQVVFHLYDDGSIAFVQSDCPDKICIHTGRISRVGQSAACLPNGIILKIVPENRDNNDADIVV